MELLIILAMVFTGYLLYLNRKYQKTLREFSDILNDAIDGKEIQLHFDEKESSRLRSLLQKFLNANQVRESKIYDEKEKTKILISDISHQTKTPITNISLYIELMEQKYCPEYLAVLKTEVGKLTFLIQQLMNSSRMETDMIQLCKENLVLSDLVGEVMNEWKERIDEKHIRLFQKQELVTVPLDRRWTKEAIHNLVDNAIKYCPDRGTIRTKIYSSCLHHHLEITNTAEPMNEEEKAKIFQRFYRGSRAVEKDGLGLGLFIAKEIIEKQGGTIAVHSQNKNITFHVSFPI